MELVDQEGTEVKAGTAQAARSTILELCLFQARRSRMIIRLVETAGAEIPEVMVAVEVLVKEALLREAEELGDLR